MFDNLISQVFNTNYTLPEQMFAFFFFVLTASMLFDLICALFRGGK